MQEIINQFLEAMAVHGLSPSSNDIKPDDKRHDFQISGDPKHKKKGFYKLKIEGDFGVGFFGDWRTGECQSWHSKSSGKRYTPEERAAFEKKIKADREKRDSDRVKDHQKVATDAQDTIIFLSDAPSDHPYLIRKGVKPYRILSYENKILIPIHDDSQIWGYQTITPEGDKYILKGCKKSGNWFHILGDDTILICEGYATGASLHEATGHTVYVAFDAYNASTVAEKLKETYPDADIIICADNDQDKEEKIGRNTGLLEGTKAAKRLGIKIIWPEFERNSGLSDFNDLHKLSGLSTLRNRIREAAKPEPECAAGGVVPSYDGDDSQASGGSLSPAPHIDDWQEGLLRNSKGFIIQRSTVNLLLIVANDEELSGVFVYDSFSKRVIVRQCPPWENDRSFKVRQLQDYDYVRLEAWLEKKWDLKTGKNRVADTIESTATLPFNTVNPASEYFMSLIWDGVPRLDDWLYKYVSDGKQPQSYLSLVGRKFLCGLAARAIKPGIKFDTMIILEGRQYAGKSFLSKVMATVRGEEYFLDDFKDIENKDALMKMQGKLVIEFPEISTMRKTEVNDLKAFLSRTHDVFRPPYGRNTIESGRQCVFVGTVNPEGPYLRDVTGNRRYWPISCRDRLDMPKLQENMEQLHAEAAHLVKSGEQLWLKDDEYQLCVTEQDKRVMTDIWIDKIEEIVKPLDEISTDDLLMQLCIPVEKRNQIVYTRLMQSMIALGFVSDRVGGRSGRKRGYRRIGSQENMVIEEVVKW